MRSSLFLAAILCTCLHAGSAVSQETRPESQPMSVVDGELGPCSVEFKVTDGSGKPIDNASVRLHLAYGFMGVKRLDLEAATNTEGKARFTGLPDKAKKGLFFQASKGDRAGAAYYDPAKNCKGQHTIVLEKHPGTTDQPGAEQQ